VTLCRTQSHSDQIALGGLEKKTIFQGIDKGHFSSALPETMDAVLTHISCARLPAAAYALCRRLHNCCSLPLLQSPLAE